MKLFLANQSKQGIGGGWTFLNTFDKFARRAGVHIAINEDDADVVLISGATMVQRPYVEELKRKGKKIVLRVDNAPRNSRNRNTGTSRLKDFASMANKVIFQSNWAREFLQPFLGKDGPVIMNGADEDVFRPDGPAQPKDGDPQHLFCQYNRDETKQWHVAWYDYIMAQRANPKAHLWLAGRFSPETQQYGFDFFMGERYRYLGEIPTPDDMAEIYRATDVLQIPYYNDAASNTLIEARRCGVEDIRWHHSGGAPEIMATDLELLSATAMVKRYLSEMVRIL